MPKKCRTCESASRELKCVYGWWCEEGFICGEDKPRETPLLVDALVEALRAIQDEDRLNELVALGRDHFNESMLILLERVFPEIGPALARYKEEVGNA